MREQLENLIEELSLLAVMLDEKDESGFQMVLESCRNLASLSAAQIEYAALHQACLNVLEAAKALERKDLLTILQSFSAKAQNYMRDPRSTDFASPKLEAGPQVDSAADPDVSPDLDRDLLAEFVAKHLLALEEFESELIQAANQVGGSTEAFGSLDGFVKSYLHNVKGEAGTVGLSGLAQVTHHVEDLLSGRSALSMIEQLLKYKEWALECIQAYSQGKRPSRAAKDFLAALQEGLEQGKSLEGNPSMETLPAESPAGKETVKGYHISGEPEVLTEFLSEAEDHLAAVEEVLVENRGNCSLDQIGAFFRAIHSVKGGSAYFNLQEITETSHVTESLLDEVRNSRLAFNSQTADVLLAYIDLQKALFRQARRALNEKCAIIPNEQTQKYLKQVETFLHGGSGPVPAKASEKPAMSQAASAVDGAGEVSEKSGLETEKPPAAPLAAESGKAGKVDVKTFLKVEAGRLDQLIDYVGELVISSSMLVQNCRRLLADNETVMKNSHQLEQILREVQYIAMSMRLVPIKGVFQKMARLVWDIGKKIGKNVIFRMEGEDTELDRTVIEKIADPLMHMVRNSIDHGIEPPEDRIRKGKPRDGLITLRAFHKGGSVHIQVIDDGRGLDAEKIRKKAVEKGLITAEQNLGKQELWQFIFAAGFSTAEAVTDISGRGVGMDVVRRNIESMRGRVLIESEVGLGTTFTIELPLTLAIIDGIETAIGPERFIIPTLAIVEFLKPTSQMVSYTLDKGEMLQFRGKFLPIFRLSRLFSIQPRYERPEESIIVIVESAGEQVAIMVDEVVGKHSTVIKSLGAMLGKSKGLAGCAIMPDGYVGLILDIQGLIALARSPEGCIEPCRLPTQEERMAGR